MGTEHDRAVRTEFRRQSPTFEGEDSFFADPRLAAWVARHLEPLDTSMLVLETACGAAHQGEAITERVGRVVAALPFRDDSFDLAFCRFAVHHFAEPQQQLDEMARVCRDGGRLAIIDLISAEPSMADAYNDFERRRDPSHTRALTADELESAVEGSGATIVHTTQTDVQVPVERWLAQASTPLDVADSLRAALRAEIDGGPPTGMRPVDGDGLSYTQTWEIVIGRVGGE